MCAVPSSAGNTIIIIIIIIVQYLLLVVVFFCFHLFTSGARKTMLTTLEQSLISCLKKWRTTIQNPSSNCPTSDLQIKVHSERQSINHCITISPHVTGMQERITDLLLVILHRLECPSQPPLHCCKTLVILKKLWRTYKHIQLAENI